MIYPEAVLDICFSYFFTMLQPANQVHLRHVSYKCQSFNETLRQGERRGQSEFFDRAR